MDFSLAQKYIKDALDDAGITLEYELTERRLTAKGTLYNEEVGDFLFVVAVFPGDRNTASCSFYFNDLPSTPKVYQLLNDFNKDAYLLHACEDELLVLEHTAERIDEEKLGEYVLDILNELKDEEVLSLLKPLINETY